MADSGTLQRDNERSDGAALASSAPETSSAAAESCGDDDRQPSRSGNHQVTGE
jgi:hypothetical protein